MFWVFCKSWRLASPRSENGDDGGDGGDGDDDDGYNVDGFTRIAVILLRSSENDRLTDVKALARSRSLRVCRDVSYVVSHDACTASKRCGTAVSDQLTCSNLLLQV